jgi:hypothetical protein
MLRKPQQRQRIIGTPKRNNEKGHERQPPKQRPIVIRIFRALKRYENRRRSRRQKDAAEYQIIMARWTRRVGLLTAALVAVGIIAAVIYGRQLIVMQGQLNEMQATRRPWMTVDVTIVHRPIARDGGMDKC